MKLPRTIQVFVWMFPLLAMGQEALVDLDPEVVSVASGGFWGQGAVLGSYRIVVSNFRFEHVVSQVIVQRIADPTRSKGPSVFSEQELVSPSLFVFGPPILEPREGTLRVTLSGAVSADLTKEVSCVFEFDSDGSYKEIKPCG